MKPIIRVENLSKQYRIGAKQASYATLRDSLTNAVAAPFRRFNRSQHPTPDTRHPETIWALKDVSFEVQPGEVVGVIGRNGAGKSTLLKILSRITEPTEGRVDLYGRVGSLLEVGTGFHAELTGRENIYLNGAILGMKRTEIERHFDEIVAFAEVEKFIDTPVKHYSNGMYLRLAFAVAAHLNPEILIVDEVLAVGDAAFQQKCLSRMGKVAKEGHTVLLVSHHLGTISSLCDNAVLLAKGRVVKTGPSVDVINNYHNELNDDGEDSSSSIQFAEDISLDAQILSAKMMDRYGKSKQQFDLFEPILVEIEYAIRKPIKGMVVEAYCINQGECLFASFDTDTCEERLRERETGIYKAIHQIPSPLLGAGHYELLYEIGILNVGLISKANRTVRFKVIEGSTNTSLLSCDTRNPGKLVVPIDWETSRIQGSKNA